MMRGGDELYPWERPSPDFADRVVLAVLREKRGAARQRAWL